MTLVRRRRFAVLLLLLAAAGVGGLLAGPTALLTEPEWSAEVVDSAGRPLRLFTTSDGRWRLRTNLAAVDPQFVRALIACEDSRFYDHPGVDVVALLRAAGQYLVNGRVVSGASTITMQTVRLLHPRPRTVGSKLIEIGEALRLERRLNKEQILSLYLSLTPCGGNLEGIEAACRFYFNKSPQRLTPSETALLIALPQSPERRRPDRFPQQAKAARNRVLARLQEAGLVSAEDAAVAAALPVPGRRFSAPFSAPHLAGRLHAAAPEKHRIVTTIDGPTQRRLEAIAAKNAEEFEPGLTFAVLVVENSSRRIIAHLGSGDFFADSQLDLTRAVRSPGSILKPFIYGLAFERGLLHPESLINDTPRRFGNYRPKNFDGRSHGEITVREALHRSLNIPAVAVLNRLGPLSFVDRLERAGVGLRYRGRAELPLALGGAGMTLEEVVSLYADLADGGRTAPLCSVCEQRPPQHPAPPLLSPAAAWYVDDILRTMPFPRGQRSSEDLRFKTGTSWGFRDAWAVGYNRHFTAGVWVGRPDGGFGCGGTGSTLAVPLLFTVFAALPSRPGIAEQPPPGVISGDTASLPSALRSFDRRGRGRAPIRPLTLLSPLDGSTIPLSADGIALSARGGTPPFHWFVNGTPLPVVPGRGMVRAPDNGVGWYRVMVVDSDGAQASARFRIRQPARREPAHHPNG